MRRRTSTATSGFIRLRIRRHMIYVNIVSQHNLLSRVRILTALVCRRVARSKTFHSRLGGEKEKQQSAASPDATAVSRVSDAPITITKRGVGRVRRCRFCLRLYDIYKPPPEADGYNHAHAAYATAPCTSSLTLDDIKSIHQICPIWARFPLSLDEKAFELNLPRQIKHELADSSGLRASLRQRSWNIQRYKEIHQPIAVQSFRIHLQAWH